MSRRLPLVLIGALTMVSMTACSADEPPEPEPYVERVAAALESGQALLGWDEDGVVGEDGPSTSAARPGRSRRGQRLG